MEQTRRYTNETQRLVVQLAAAVQRPDAPSRLLGVLDVLDLAQLWGTRSRAALAYALAQAELPLLDTPKVPVPSRDDLTVVAQCLVAYCRSGDEALQVVRTHLATHPQLYEVQVALYSVPLPGEGR